MRLWHYKLIPFLPNSQLMAQWRELNSIYVKQDDHILINYVYEYPKENLLAYSLLVIKEMLRRDIDIKKWANYDLYFKDVKLSTKIDNPFPNHHDNRYLLQCFYNLQEKYDRGQKDFSHARYWRIYNLVRDTLGEPPLNIF